MENRLRDGGDLIEKKSPRIGLNGNVTHLKKIRFNLKKIIFLRIGIFISISNQKNR